MNLHAEKLLHRSLFRACWRQQVDPYDVLKYNLGKHILRLGDLDPSVFSVEDIQHIISSFNPGQSHRMDFTYYNQLALTENAACKFKNKIFISKRKTIVILSCSSLVFAGFL